jgi:hypothetical protein
MVREMGGRVIASGSRSVGFSLTIEDGSTGLYKRDAEGVMRAAVTDAGQRQQICGPNDDVIAVRGVDGWFDPRGVEEPYCTRVRYTIGDDEYECSMVEFLDANIETIEDPEVWDLLTGGTIWVGGGAAPDVQATGVRS